MSTSESSDNTLSYSSSASDMDMSSCAEPQSVSDDDNLGTSLLLKEDSPLSTIRVESISALAERYLISDLSLVRAARPGEKADSINPGWVSLYELPFESGLLLPLPKLLLDTCRHYDIAPAQLMPNAWRLILSLVRLSEKLKEPFTVGDLLHTYHTKSRRDEPGRYSLAVRPGRRKIVLKLAKSDRAWKDRFFFVKAEAVFEGYVGVSESWRSLVTSRVKLPKTTKAKEERVEKFLSFSKKKRSWCYLLSLHSLKNSSLWRVAAKKYQTNMELPSLDDVLKRHISDVHQQKSRARASSSPFRETQGINAGEISSEPNPVSLAPDIADSAPESTVGISSFMVQHEGPTLPYPSGTRGSSFYSIGTGESSAVNATKDLGRITTLRNQTTSGPTNKRLCVTPTIPHTTHANAEPEGGVSAEVPKANVPDIHLDFTFPGDTSLFSNSSPIIDEMSRFRFPEDDVYLGQMSETDLFDHGLLYSFGSMQVWYDFRRRYSKMEQELGNTRRARDEAQSELEYAKADAERQRKELDSKFKNLTIEMNFVREVNKNLEGEKLKLSTNLDEVKVANDELSQSLRESTCRADGLAKLVAQLEAGKATLEHRCRDMADFATVKTAAEIYREVYQSGVDLVRMKAAEEAHEKLKHVLARYTIAEDITTSSDPIDTFLLTTDHDDSLHPTHDHPGLPEA